FRRVLFRSPKQRPSQHVTYPSARHARCNIWRMHSPRIQSRGSTLNTFELPHVVSRPSHERTVQSPHRPPALRDRALRYGVAVLSDLDLLMLLLGSGGEGVTALDIASGLLGA